DGRVNPCRDFNVGAWSTAPFSHSSAIYLDEQPWNVTWGGPVNDYGDSIWSDGFYLYTCGSTGSFGVAGSSDLVLIKWDFSGNKVWNVTWGGFGQDQGYSVWGDGNYLYTCGSTGSFGVGYDDLILVKWDADGNQVWNRTWGGFDQDRGYSVWGDGNYLYTCGKTNCSGGGDYDLLLVKWDVNGTPAWNRTWGGSDGDFGKSVWGDGNYLYTCGRTYSFGAGGSDLLLVKWDVIAIDVYEDPQGDFDSDGLSNGHEIYIYNTNAIDNGTDSDGLSDGDEVLVYMTNATNNDTDDDGMPDGWEVNNSLDPLSDDSADDPDLDALANILEYNSGSDPQDNDTDDDGMPDGWEVNNSLDPLSDDSADDPDGDGFSNLEEYHDGTDPHSHDSSTTNAAILGYDPILIILALIGELMMIVFVLMALKRRGCKTSFYMS
ncbi:MAG: hypothetical protein ACTSXP_07330, partial [Promethearchaeota archaeon]